MMDEASKVRLLDEFRAYLETGDEAGEVPEEGSGGIDLFSLFGEMAALRTEVKTEGRLLRTTQDELKEVQAWLRDSQGQMDRELERFRGEFPGLRRAALRPLLVELLNLHDGLSAGRDALQNYHPIEGGSWFHSVKSHPEDQRFIESVREGQGMSLRRLEEILVRQQVRPMEILGKPVDPHTMQVMALDHQPELENGVVTAELRKGFLWGDEILRLAEVKANKL
ncbi:MAG: nucleotide exchange factor GrpE [Pseudomonadota bacterium]